VSVYEDVVFLLPGFFGFDRFAGFYYFADRASATLRGALESRLRRRIPVVPLTTAPTSSLKARQAKLLEELERHYSNGLRAKRYHLVGHSTGGVDAQLLVCKHPLPARPRGGWPSAEWKPWDEAGSVRRFVHSTVSIAAPHRGTYLVHGNAVQALRDSLGLDLARVPALVGPVASLVASLVRRPDFVVDVARSLGAQPELARFIIQCMLHRDLYDDLAPPNMEALRTLNPPVEGARHTSFVTVVAKEAEAASEDAFFKKLYAMTATVRGDMNADVTAAASLLDGIITERGKTRVPVIHSNDAPFPVRVDANLNDGVVNTTRQIVNTASRDELGAVVLADHGDVLGHYDRMDASIGGRPVNDGIFDSGEKFGDDQFFELWGLVADRIMATVQ
jgi:pimeloyl-ACP methyl ester carboxylesterase